METMLIAGVLASVRIGSLFVFAPIFSSDAIAPRIKAGFVLTMTILMAPVIALRPGIELSMTAVLGELAVGLLLGLTLSLLTETVMFAATLIGMQFSFSLVNLIDPVSKVETPVLGQLLGWTTTLVLLGAGLHRTLLHALLASFDAVPAGSFVMSAMAGRHLVMMASGIFTVGLQLASPVMAAGLPVEIAAAFVARVSPQLPTTILNVPVKTAVSYAVLMGSLALWPVLLERRFDALLLSACRLLQHG